MSVSKIVVKYWLFNLLISIILYILYRYTIIQTAQKHDELLWDKLMRILSIMLNFGLIFIYLFGMLCCSLGILLNLFKRIRYQFILSFLSFLGIPAIYLIFILISFVYDGFLSSEQNPIHTFIIFIFAYVLCTLIQFLLFRKRIKILESLCSQQEIN